MKRFITIRTFEIYLKTLLILFIGWGVSTVNAQCDLAITVNGGAYVGGNVQVQLNPGDCNGASAVLFSLTNNTCVAGGCEIGGIAISFPDGSGQAISHVNTTQGISFPIGLSEVTFSYSSCDATSTLTSVVGVKVNEYATPSTAMACNDQVQISLNENCSATIGADLILEGGPYRCYDTYIITVEDKNGISIDRDPTTPGVQLDRNDFGNCYSTTVTDPVTGNSCWGKICVEDKLAPKLTCPQDILVDCGSSLDPSVTGQAVVFEACNPNLVVTYTDEVEDGSCAQNIDKRIKRTFRAEDPSGNVGTCVQTITVKLGVLDLTTLQYPTSFDGLPTIDLLRPHAAPLTCDTKKNDIDYSSHYNDAAFVCGVDDYILDKDYLLGYGTRRPDTLGWNYITGGQYAGHPNPATIYYPAKPGCWPANTVVKWQGTGYPGAEECGNIQYTYKDTKINIATAGCDAGDVGCYKILRRWILLDWCSSTVEEITQIIVVMDLEGPEILMPDEIEISTSAWACSATWNVPAPDLTDNCSNDVHYTVTSSAGTVLGSEASGYVITGLDIGTSEVYIEASDCCGNVSKKVILVHVKDLAPPVAVCDGHTVVSLTPGVIPGKNYSKIYAETFDDGSHDNCNDVYFKVIRMDELLGTVHGSFADNLGVCDGIDGDDDVNLAGNQVYFDDFVKFCCEDVGNTIMIVFRVFDVDPGKGQVHPRRLSNGDLKGHYTDCMVEVDVQDKTIPVVVAPADMVVTCMYWFDDSETALTDVDNPTFGKFVKDIKDRSKIVTKDKVCEYFCEANSKTGYPYKSALGRKACDFYNNLYDPSHPDDLHNLTWGFDGYAAGSCALDCSIRIEDRRECGQGPIYRYFTATAGGQEFTDVQVIWVVDCDPFEVSEICQDLNDDIIWPLNCNQPRTLEGCGANTSPDNPVLGRPEVTNGGDDNCALISIDHDDKQYTIEKDACFKILRDWVVIDWCQFDITIDLKDANGNLDFYHPHPGEWHYLQVIKVKDNNRPIVDIKIGDCEPADKDSLWKCLGHIDLSVTADDECTPDAWLNYEYKIDLHNDGSIDAVVGPAKPGSIPNVKNNPYADDPKDVLNASGVYPLGWHKITWYVEDGCGNIGTKDSLFHIKDCKAPTPYCRTGIVTVVMPSSGSITVWANDLNIGSFDNCTEKEDLKYYFNGDVKWTGYQINCDSFAAHGVTGSLVVLVEMWVEDEEGNTDYCRTTIEVQDPNGVCGTTVLKAAIGGSISTDANDMMENAKVELKKNGSSMKDQITSGVGVYAFYDLPMKQDYEVAPFNNKDPLNGVSTRDLVAIQKHLLGIKIIDNAYTLLAADANGNESVSTSDISYLRKLILGKKDVFENTTSWTFVPSSYVFDDQNNPWSSAIPRSISFVELESRAMSSNFTAIKTGDVTGDVIVNGAQKIKTRSTKSLILMAQDQEFDAGQIVEVAIRANDFNAIEGIQYTLNYDVTAMSFEGVVSGALTMTNMNVANFDHGAITTSWHEIGGVTLANNEVLFTMVFIATDAGSLSEMMTISSSMTPAEAFTANDEDFNVSLRFRDVSTNDLSAYELYQNVPNPFNDATTIGFYLPEANMATLNVYNVVGKVLHVQRIQAKKGYNEVNLQTRDIKGSGVLYYQLSAGDFTATKKMIITD